MTCDEAMAMLAAAAGAASPGREEPALRAKVADHVASCPYCLEELAVLGTLASGETSTLLDDAYRINGCELLGCLLPEWVASNAGTDSLRTQHAAAWRHMTACERCQTEYSDLRELIMAARAGEFGPIPGDRAADKPRDEIAAVLRRRLAHNPGDLAIDLVNPACSWSPAERGVRSAGGREDAAVDLILGMVARPGVVENREDVKIIGWNDARPMVLAHLQAGWSMLNPGGADLVPRAAIVNAQIPRTRQGG